MTKKEKVENDSESEKIFKVVGICKRGEDGKFYCDIEPFDPDYIENEDFPEEAVVTIERVENYEDFDTPEDPDSKIE